MNDLDTANEDPHSAARIVGAAVEGKIPEPSTLMCNGGPFSAAIVLVEGITQEPACTTALALKLQALVSMHPHVEPLPRQTPQLSKTMQFPLQSTYSLNGYVHTAAKRARML